MLASPTTRLLYYCSWLPLHFLVVHECNPHARLPQPSPLQVMLYDDGEGDCITPEHVFDVLEEDLKVGVNVYAGGSSV